VPELPEVETIKSGLQTLLKGKVIESLSFDWPKSYPNSLADTKQFLYGAKIVKVRRRAKVLIIDLSSDYSLVIHLKMTGQLVYKDHKVRYGGGHPNESLISKLPDKSTRVIITFKDTSQLFFNDQRKFGWMKLMPTSMIENLDFFKKLGPEPLEKDFSAEVLKKRLKRRPNSSVKAALLDQSVIAGVGNIYADETLWGAKVKPARLVKDIKNGEFTKLYHALVDVLRLSIKLGGSTDRNYLSAEGKKGSYLAFASVFRKEDQACPRCGHTILKTRVASRGTHYCPHCQK